MARQTAEQQHRRPAWPILLDGELTAASAIGDDRLQRRAGQDLVPDSFTHGSSEQRMNWFRRGFESGNVRECDTFSASLK